MPRGPAARGRRRTRRRPSSTGSCAAFGYTEEELELIVGAMATSGAEPVGSMGDDTPLAALSERPRLLSAYFKQHFAQVTNPPIDPQREALVMSLRTSVGAIGNLLDERPEDCRAGGDAERPVLKNGGAREAARGAARLRRRDAADASTGSRTAPPASSGRSTRLCREASRAVWDGAAIVDPVRPRRRRRAARPIPPLLATAAVHSHLVREGARTMCGLVVESGEPRETMHFALLLGYGAAAVNPYLALETLRAERPAGCRYRRGAVGRAASLKICSKMGISTVQSYRGAQIFEAVGLGPRPGRPLLHRHRLAGRRARAAPTCTPTMAQRHAAAFTAPDAPRDVERDRRRVPAARRRGERHAWDPDTIAGLQRAVRDDAPTLPAHTPRRSTAEAAARTLRGLLEPGAGRPAARRSATVEPSAAIVRRFATGAMSLGVDLAGGARDAGHRDEPASAAARTPARAARIWRRSVPDPNGDLRRSAIKQVASGRFGVTAATSSTPTSCRSRSPRARSPARAASCRATR